MHGPVSPLALVVVAIFALAILGAYVCLRKVIHWIKGE